MNFTTFYHYILSKLYKFTNFFWILYDYIGNLRPSSPSKTTLISDIVSSQSSPPFEFEKEEEEQEEKKTEENDELMEGVDSSVKQVYFNKDEIVSMFNESKNKFLTSADLEEKIYYFTKLSTFQFRKMDKIIKEQLDSLWVTETEEVFLSILKHVDWSISKEYYIKHFYNSKLLYYKVISARPVFQKVFYDDVYKHKEKERNVYNDTLKFLFDRAADENESINIRADCLDTIVTYGRKHEKEKADDMILELGQLYIEDKERSFYTNSQNVHTRGIQKTAISSLTNLATYHRPSENVDAIYEMILNKLVSDEDKREKVIKSLKRIIIDPTLFQGFNVSQILSIIWQEIERLEKYKDELENRLIEELYDADETCSSGYFTRLINVLSGFSPHVKIGITIEEELIARVIQGIKNHINTLDFLEKERLSLEMMEEDNDPTSFRNQLRSRTYEDIWENIVLKDNYTGHIKEEHIKEMINIKLRDYFGK